MLVAKDFREKARTALRGKWAVAIGTGFVAGVLGACTALGYSKNGVVISEEDNEILISRIINVISEEKFMLILFAMLLVCLVLMIFCGVISVGYAQFNLNLVDEKDAAVSDLFGKFHIFGKAFAMQFLRVLFFYLWTLCFVIPGIIAYFRYALAPYLMAEDPNIGAYEANKESARLMKGNKWRLFCLNLSFFGWYLLCVLTLGIGDLWVRPYKEAAYAAFYREIKGKNTEEIEMDYINSQI